MKIDNIKPCPKCNGKIELHSRYYYTNGSNCFARCELCKTEFNVPTELKVRGVKIYPASIKKAYRIWNETANNLI